MADKTVALGIVIGATLSNKYFSVFDSVDQRAKKLGKAFADTNRKLTAAKEVTQYQTQLKNLQSVQYNAGQSADTLQRNIASVGLKLEEAKRKAKNYGLSIGDITREQSRLGRESARLETNLKRLHKAEAAKQKLGAIKGRALGALGVAYSVAQPFKEAISFEHELRLFGNVVNFNNRQLADTKTRLNAVSRATNQTPGELLAALNTLSAKGLESGKALASLDIIGRTATASGANVNDLANTAFTLIDAMGLSPEQLPKALDMLAQSGKAGSFELRDMAQYFPMLTAQAKSLGMTGMDGIASLGAALQIAMKGASDPSQAANNFQNFLAKLTSPETVKKFDDMGVNIQDKMKAAMAAGKDPVIEMINVINDLTQGDKFKIGELFGDMQVINFLNPMLANMKEFNKIKADSLAADGVVNKDFNAMMGTSQEQMKALSTAIDKIGNAFASTLLPALNAVLTPLSTAAVWIGNLISSSPVLSYTVGALAIGFVGYGAALVAVTAAQWLGNSAMIAATNTVIGQAAAFLWSKGVMMATAIATQSVTAAQWLWNAAMTANPIGLVIAGIAAFGALAYTVYKNWEPIMAWFSEKFAWLGKSVDWVKGLGSSLGFGGGGAKASGPKSGVMGTVPAKALPDLNLAGAVTSPQVQNVTNAPINVYQQPGENSGDLAKRISAELARSQAADKRRALHD